MTTVQQASPIASSMDMDHLVNQVMYLIEDKAVTTIPQTLEASRVEHLDSIVSRDDLERIENIIKALSLSSYELCVLSEIIQWNTRNTSAHLKAISATIGFCVKRLIPEESKSRSSRTAVSAGNIMESFLSESPETIRHVFKSAVLNGNVAAKIPMTAFKQEIQAAVAAPAFGTRHNEDLKRLLLTTSSQVNLQTRNFERYEYITRLLIQICKAVSEYKSEDTFSALRSFLNNAGHISTMVRVYAARTENHELVRLVCDVNDQVHSMDRLLSSNAVLARQLLSRMVDNNEVVYKQLLELASHQHRLISIEGHSVATLFSYLIKVIPPEMTRDYEEINKSLSRLMRYADINGTYINELTAAMDS